MFCEKCGRALQEGQIFCSYCGNKNETVVKKVKKSKLPFVFVAIILFVSIIVGVVFIPGLFKNKNEKTTIWVATEYSINNFFKLEFSYREDGLVSDVSRWLYSDTISEEKMEHIYDKNLNLTELTYSDSDRSRFFTYDKNGNMLSDIIYFEGETENATYYTYNENERLTEKTDSNYKYIYEYDKKGNLIYEKEIDSNGNISEISHKYDSFNRRIETEDSIGKSAYKYDLKNRLVEIIRYTDGSEEGRCIFEYDEHGNLISVKKIASREDIHIYGDFAAGDIINMTTVKYMPIEVDSDMAKFIKEKQGFEWLFDDIYNYNNW